MYSSETNSNIESADCSSLRASTEETDESHAEVYQAVSRASTGSAVDPDVETLKREPTVPPRSYPAYARYLLSHLSPTTHWDKVEITEKTNMIQLISSLVESLEPLKNEQSTMTILELFTSMLDPLAYDMYQQEQQSAQLHLAMNASVVDTSAGLSAFEISFRENVERHTAAMESVANLKGSVKMLMIDPAAHKRFSKKLWQMCDKLGVRKRHTLRRTSYDHLKMNFQYLLCYQPGVLVNQPASLVELESAVQIYQDGLKLGRILQTMDRFFVGRRWVQYVSVARLTDERLRDITAEHLEVGLKHLTSRDNDIKDIFEKLPDLLEPELIDSHQCHSSVSLLD